MSEWDDFLDETQLDDVPRGPKCTVRQLLDSLPADAAKQVEAALEDPAVTHAAIARALRVRIGSSAPKHFTIGNHRRGNCRCE